MQGLVTLDFGNSRPTAGLFQKHQTEWKLLKVVPLSELPLYLNQLQMSSDNTSMVLAEVKSQDEEVARLQEQGFLITRVKDYWRGQRFAGMPVHYAHTLGEDRLIQAFYIYKTIKKRTLLLDAGTFLTMDVITENGFEGGYIIPGLQQYLEIFKNGELLKSIALDQNLSPDLPHGSAEAMRDSYFAFAALAQKLVSEHKIEKILLSGGQSTLWEKLFHSLPSLLCVQVEPSLVHSSLHYWMTTQIELL